MEKEEDEYGPGTRAMGRREEAGYGTEELWVRVGLESPGRGLQGHTSDRRL